MFEVYIMPSKKRGPIVRTGKKGGKYCLKKDKSTGKFKKVYVGKSRSRRRSVAKKGMFGMF